MTHLALLSAVIFSLSARPVAAATPTDPLIGRQWYLDAIGMPEAWDFAKGSPTIRVAILDSGIDLTHPDLKDRIWTNRGEVPGDGIDNDRNGYVDDVHGWDFIENDADTNPDMSDPSLLEGINHGTLVAGIIGAAGGNGEGMTGINWNVELMPLRVLYSDGSGRTAAVEAAVRYAITEKVNIINISFIGSSYSASLEDALRQAYRAGIVIVAAAGNEGDTERGGNLNVYPEYPVCYRGPRDEPIVIGVSSLDRRGQRSSFSNYGSDCITVSAPGEGMLTTQVLRPDVSGFNEPYGDGWSGSSLAAPVVSGVAALMLSLNPSMSPSEVRARITAYAVKIDDINGGYGGQLGAGRIDAAASIAAVQAALLALPSDAIPQPAPVVQSPRPGTLIKSTASSAVYYLAADGKRYVFPNAKTYATWFPDFKPVKTVTPAALAAFPIGGNVPYRPGTRLLKLSSQSDVYAVGKGGVLRHVASEDAASSVFGPAWATLVDDLPDVFFVDYRLGAPILSGAEYDPASERAAAPTIDAGRGLGYTGN